MRPMIRVKNGLIKGLLDAVSFLIVKSLDSYSRLSVQLQHRRTDFLGPARLLDGARIGHIISRKVVARRPSNLPQQNFPGSHPQHLRERGPRISPVSHQRVGRTSLTDRSFSRRYEIFTPRCETSLGFLPLLGASTYGAGPIYRR